MGRKRNKHSRKKSFKEVIKTTEVEDKGIGEESINNSNYPDCSSRKKTITEEIVPQCSELSFKKYFPKSERFLGREYFVHSLCQLCKKDLSERFPCEKCSLVNYCSKDHRRLHWPEHAELCRAVQDLCRSRGEAHVLQSGLHLHPEPFRVLRYRNMLDCEARVQRFLEKWEKEIFIFPDVCGTCHQYKRESLLICERCNHQSYCEGHQSNHDEWCSHLLKYKMLVKDQNKFGIICPSIPKCEISSSLPKLSNIDNAFENIRTNFDELEFTELTEILTYPLTTLYTLLHQDDLQTFNFDRVVIHVIGAEREFETNKLEKWEFYLLHLIPTLHNLTIEFIGPELNIRDTEEVYNVCNDCLSAKKSLTFRFQNQLYHELITSSKPNLICVFNPGLYRTSGFDGQDSWTPTIVRMLSQECPVLTTAYTRKEVYLDVDRVKFEVNVRLLKEPTVNPFSSLKPNLNFVSDEESPVIFKNQFYTLIIKA